MELEYDYWIGTEKNILNGLSRSLGQFKRHYKNVRIGITSNLEKRRLEHSSDQMFWDLMVIKCRTNSMEFIIELKETLADSKQDFISNEKNNRGYNRNLKHYIYVLLKEY